MGPQSGLRPGMEVGGFRLPDYAEDGTLESQLFGEHALALSNGLIEIRGLRIEMYKDGQVETRVTSPHCLYDRERQSAGSTSSVRITRGEVVITGDDYLYSPRRQRFEIHTNARVVLRDARHVGPEESGDGRPDERGAGGDGAMTRDRWTGGGARLGACGGSPDTGPGAAGAAAASSITQAVPRAAGAVNAAAFFPPRPRLRPSPPRSPPRCRRGPRARRTMCRPSAT